MMSAKPILILGAGINGVAAAREIVLNGVPVCVVDTADIASGTTAYSSRLIHGGLRYLEYGDLDLVRESLDERRRLLRLAPQFVQPLRLSIPIERRMSGLRQAIGRFFGLPVSKRSPHASRGLWLVRLGLRLYDLYARDATLPRHAVHRVGAPAVPPVCPRTFRWMCAYWDAQIEFPERFVVALLDDARALAAQRQIEFHVFTYHRAQLHGRKVSLFRQTLRPDTEPKPHPVVEFEPAAIINATGAWVDRTLRRLNLPAPRLIGATKGSHLLTAHPLLRRSLCGQGIYAEGTDGRPIFLLPLGELTLVGTTDVPFDASPETAIADDDEIEYLLNSVNRIFPDVSLTSADIELHYSGVRPLPYTSGATPASITRRHFLAECRSCPVPLFSMVGGKLTTCRSLAEQSARVVLARIGIPITGTSRNRVVPGAESYPRDELAKQQEQLRLAQTLGFSLEQIRQVWRLCGTRAEQSLTSHRCGAQASAETVAQSALPVCFVRHVIRNEWVARLADLVERRLMLLYKRDLSDACLRHLAQLMADEEVLAASEIEGEIERCTQRLQTHFGKHVAGQSRD